MPQNPNQNWLDPLTYLQLPQSQLGQPLISPDPVIIPDPAPEPVIAPRQSISSDPVEEFKRIVNENDGMVFQIPTNYTLDQAKGLIALQTRQNLMYGGWTKEVPYTSVEQPGGDKMMPVIEAPDQGKSYFERLGIVPNFLRGLATGEKNLWGPDDPRPIVGEIGNRRTGFRAGISRPVAEIPSAISTIREVGPRAALDAILEQGKTGAATYLPPWLLDKFDKYTGTDYAENPPGEIAMETIPFYGPQMEEIAATAEGGDVAGALGMGLFELASLGIPGMVGKAGTKFGGALNPKNVSPDWDLSPPYSVRTGKMRVLQGLLERSPGSEYPMLRLSNLANRQSEEIVTRLFGSQGIDPRPIGIRLRDELTSTVNRLVEESAEEAMGAIIINSKRAPRKAGFAAATEARQPLTPKRIRELLDLPKEELLQHIDSDLVPQITQLRNARKIYRKQLLHETISDLQKKDPSLMGETLKALTVEDIEYLKGAGEKFERLRARGVNPKGTPLISPETFDAAASILVQEQLIKRRGVSDAARKAMGLDPESNKIPANIRAEMANIDGQSTLEGLAKSAGDAQIIALVGSERALALKKAMEELAAIQSIPASRLVLAMVITGQALAPIAGLLTGLTGGTISASTLLFAVGGVSIIGGLRILGEFMVMQPGGVKVSRRLFQALASGETAQIISAGNAVKALMADFEPSPSASFDLGGDSDFQTQLFDQPVPDGPPPRDPLEVLQSAETIRAPLTSGERARSWLLSQRARRASAQ
jgi:hypothetical protein